MASEPLPKMLTKRLKVELERFKNKPPLGITLSQRLDELHILDATIRGPEGTPYEGGEFKLLITLNRNYPFEPPNVKFITPVYHPNIDRNGLICHEILKSNPGGKWRPIINLEMVLNAIRILLSSPDIDDPLEHDIASEYLYHRNVFNTKAMEHTRKYATWGFSS